MEIITLPQAGDARIVVVDEGDKLAQLQSIVGGLVESVSLTPLIDLIFHEEHLYDTDARVNEPANALLRHFEIALMPGDEIRGDAAIVGVRDYTWISTPSSTADTLAWLGFPLAPGA